MTIPPCTALGRHCVALDVTLRIGELEEGDDSLDHEATWLLGHTEHISFRELWEGDGDLYVDAALHVPCKHLERSDGRARCRAHGFRGRVPGTRPTEQPRQLGGSQFTVVESRALVQRSLALPPTGRALPVLAEANPCDGAPCRTADNRRHAACCRDLQVEIMCTREQRRLEALVRSRQSPYLCKVTREGEFSIEAELISACGYLEPGSVNCTLHGRKRPDGRPAKPDLCSEWPPRGQALHPGCVYRSRRRPRRVHAE